MTHKHSNISQSNGIFNFICKQTKLNDIYISILPPFFAWKSTVVCHFQIILGYIRMKLVTWNLDIDKHNRWGEKQFRSQRTSLCRPDVVHWLRSPWTSTKTSVFFKHRILFENLVIQRLTANAQIAFCSEDFCHSMTNNQSFRSADHRTFWALKCVQNFKTDPPFKRLV